MPREKRCTKKRIAEKIGSRDENKQNAIMTTKMFVIFPKKRNKEYNG